MIILFFIKNIFLVLMLCTHYKNFLASPLVTPCVSQPRDTNFSHIDRLIRDIFLAQRFNKESANLLSVWLTCSLSKFLILIFTFRFPSDVYYILASVALCPQLVVLLISHVWWTLAAMKNQTKVWLRIIIRSKS